MADKTVLMEHPKLTGKKYQPKRVSRSSYEKVWKDRGWRIHTSKKKEGS